MQVFQEAQQAAVARALPSKCLLNVTESEKACHEIGLNLQKFCSPYQLLEQP